MNSCNQNDCKHCKHVLQFASDCHSEYEYEAFGNSHDYYCAHPDLPKEIKDGQEIIQTKLLECYVEEYDTINIPDWCPRIARLNRLLSNNNMAMLQKTKKNHIQQKEALIKAEGMSTWDSIVKDKIYHLPPILNEKRGDYIVINKSEFCLTMKEVNVATGEINNNMKYFYKSCDGHLYKFLVELKNKNVV